MAFASIQKPASGMSVLWLISGLQLSYSEARVAGQVALIAVNFSSRFDVAVGSANIVSNLIHDHILVTLDTPLNSSNSGNHPGLPQPCLGGQ